ncbi:Os11g0247000, partial [Oryza sativa Japonica Group]
PNLGFVAMEGVGARQRRNPLIPRPNGSKRHLQHQHQPNAAEKKTAATSNYFSIEAFLVLVFLTMSLLILPLVLPPLPPPPSLLLLLPVCLLILLVVLAFMPTDVRSMASSYL